MGCMVLCRTFHTAAEQGQGRMGYISFSGPETTSGGVFQLYFNHFQVSSPGRRHNQYEWILSIISVLVPVQSWTVVQHKRLQR